MIGFFRRLYGEGPLHLILHLVAFAIAAFALDQILSAGTQINFAVWFVGAAILHDAVFLPIYSGINRVAQIGIVRAFEGRAAPQRAARRVPVINHLRAPVFISGILLIVYFPLIFKTADTTYFNATGHHVQGYLRNWLLITAALFLVSAVIYAVRLRRAVTPAPSAPAQ